MNLNRRLVVIRSRENFGPAGWDRRVALDETVHDAAFGLDTKRQWGDVQQQDVFDITFQHTSLHGRTNGHDFIRVDTFVWLFAGQLLNKFLNGGDTR